GSFECGHFKLNRLYQNICWGQRDNFLEIPTDCPQRDERLGWTGDAQIFCGTAAINMDVAAFFRKYLEDLRDAQAENGMVSHIAPNIWKGNGGAAAWADAAVICPWTVYMAYGDPQILEENFDMMRRWVDYQKESSENLIRPQTAFGDWLALSKVKTPSPLIGTAYFVRSAEFTGRAAEVLGKTVEAEYYLDLSKQIREVFCKNFLDSDGIVTPATQTGLALALHFDILPEKFRARNAAVLDELISENGNKLDTGFVGTGCLNLALSENNCHARACELYLQEDYPSWLFSVNQGATTMWERWNSYTVKDGFGDVNMNSFNHYAYGAVHEWVMRHICGIRIVSPGGREICFAAEPDRRLGFVNSSLKTPYGKVESCWKFEDDKLLWHISAPANTRMKLILPEKWRCDVPTDLPCGTYELVLTREK
ncbi:MAG: alpha-L-rhamnosidase, partial [Lentisphaeria bacterium]|nr:alpha-L-rhamnosidase [Lentisphaeria bacterium]